MVKLVGGIEYKTIYLQVVASKWRHDSSSTQEEKNTVLENGEGKRKDEGKGHCTVCFSPLLEVGEEGRSVIMGHNLSMVGRLHRHQQLNFLHLRDIPVYK